MSTKVLFGQKSYLKIHSKDSLENIILKKINFKNTFVSTKALKTYIQNIESTLKKRGFFYNRSEKLKKKDSIYSLQLSLGKKIDSIQLSLPSNFKTNTNFKTTIPFNKLQPYLDKIKNSLENNGQPFSKIKLKNIHLKNNLLIADVNINISKKRTVDKIIIRGYREFPKSFLTHFLKLKKNTLFTPLESSKISDNLQSLTFIKEIKPPEVLFTNDSTTIHIYLKKLKKNSFDGLISFGSNPQGDIQVTGNVYLDLINLLNTGEEFKIRWNANGNDSQNFGLSTKIPYIFNTAISNTSALKIHKQDSSFLNSKFNTNLLYNLNPKAEIGISLESENSTNTLKTTNNSVSNFSSLFGGINFSYNIPKTHPLFEKQFHLSINYLIGNRTSNNIKTNQQKINLTTSLIYDINYRNSIFLKNETGLVFSSNYLNNELFRIGGPNSIRGYQQQSLFTPKYSFINLEYRFLTSKNSYLYSITDFGLIQNINRKSNKLFGYGLGYLFRIKNTQINITASGNSTDFNNNQKGFNLLLTLKNFF